MVKAPVNSVSFNHKPVQVHVNTASGFHHHHHSTSGSNNKKHRRTHMTTESPGAAELLGTVPVVASGPGTSSGTLVVTTMAVTVSGASAVTVPPLVAVVAPTTLASTSNIGVMKQGTNTTNAQRITAATPFLYHQLSALPIQIPAGATTAQATGAWPIVEPAFHFGPGFEPRTMCPAHNPPQNNTEHVVLFHVSPGVSVTFQVGGKHEVVRGK